MADYPEFPRYCGSCGEIFDGRADSCPECSAAWPSSLPDERLACYAVLLTEAQDLHHRGEIGTPMFTVLRRIYEDRLIAIRPARRPKPAPALVPPPMQPAYASVPVAAIPQPIARPAATIAQRSPWPTAPANPPKPPAPPRDVAGDLRNWAARRQADLVLYLGAFMLSISALIFVSYQGSGLDGIAKSGLFGAYTLMFIVLGMRLRSWKRVQEAGPVFLALGAILTPLNFVALYTNVLRNEDVAQSWVWLAGSAGTSALYFLLAKRGFGRLYAIPGGIAAIIAYASLGASLQLPAEWFGPWFLALAVGANVFAHRQPVALRRWIEAGAIAVAIAALAFTQLLTLFAETQDAALPVAYAFALALLTRSAFPSKRAEFLGALPVFATLTIATAAWSAGAWSEQVLAWTPLWFIVAAAGYLAVARIRPGLAEVWASVSLLFGLAGVGLAHLAVEDGDIASRLPFAYAAAALLAGATYFERRYTVALAFVPALLAATAATTLWAAGLLAFEWLGSFAAAAGLGYVLLARRFKTEATLWRLLAAASAGVALVVAHVAAGTPEIHRWELAAVYGIIAAGAMFDALRLRPSALVALFSVAIGAAASLWALDIAVAYWALPAPALGLAVVLSERAWSRDAALRKLGWPAVVALGLSPLLILPSFADAAWLGALNLGIAAATLFAVGLRSNGALAAIAGYTSERAARIERQMLARAGGWMLFGAGGFANLALGLTPVEGAWTFAAAGIACWLAIAVLRGRIGSLEEVLAPVGLTAAVVAVFAAYPNYGHAAMMLGAFSVAASLAIGGRYPMAWRFAGLAAGLFALLFGHNQAEAIGRDAWQLPAAYGLLLAALLWDSARNRFEPSMLAVPGIAAIGATAFAWWQSWPLEHMAWAPLAIAFAIVAAESLWKRGAVVRRGAWPWVLVLSLAPFALVGRYETAAWDGAAAFGLSTFAWALAAWRSNGALAQLSDLRPESAPRHERQVLALCAYAIGLVALAQLHFALELPLADAAWTFVALGSVALAATCTRSRRLATWDTALVIAGAAGFIIGIGAVLPATGPTAAMLGIAAALSLGSGLARLSSPRVLFGASLSALAAAITWEWAEWQWWTLALAYAGTAAALFAALAPARKRTTVLHSAVTALSFGPVLLAIATALFVTAARDIAAAIDNESLAIVTTAEWAVLASTVALAGAMLVFEGLYRKGRAWVVAGSAVLLLALELAIAMLEPANVQAYTVPAALYLIGLGLATRRSEQLFGSHMSLHEVLFVLGSAVLVLPAAEQSFAPGGSNWGLLVIAEGVALLAIGLALFQRWLVVAGVMTLVGVAGRFFLEGTGTGRIPYWVTLGAIGLGLLGIGVLMLLERDWWDRTKARLAHWWLETDELGPAV